MKYRTLKDFKFSNKEVLVRVDFNVPLDEKGRITDDKRIRAALPTIKYLIKQNAMVILMSHLGRPKGEIVESLRMDAVAERLSKLLGKEVVKMDECIGSDVEDYVDEMVPGEVILLENLRFYPEEKDNNAEFAQELAELAQFYVNDAFGTCHRADASVEAVTRYLPGCAGFLVEKEIKVMGKALEKPKKPFIAVMGGVKVSDKIEVINNLLKKVDKLLIGGAMMFTFLKAKGHDVGKSIVEDDKIALAKKLLKNRKIVLPVDCVAGDKFEKNAKPKIVGVDKIKGMGLDIGPKTIKMYSDLIKKSKTVIWNGPMGKFEWKKFSKGTDGVAKAMAKSKAVTIVGGGDSAAAVEQLKLEGKMTHVSTGGGASLDFFAGKKLPGLVALEKNYRQFKK
ncbi:phosphoglycerate kinase [Candidatus Woesearchaeota archaeon]|nr:phosphoglycerate kinase [Candidatus Woesearchaeota archaeon]